MYKSAFEALDVEAVIVENGTEALRAFRSARERGQGFNVVLLDLTLPGGKSGAMVLGDLRELDPGVRAVVTSGYTNAPEMTEFRESGFVAALAKPFSVQRVSQDGPSAAPYALRRSDPGAVSRVAWAVQARCDGAACPAWPLRVPAARLQRATGVVRSGA